MADPIGIIGKLTANDATAQNPKGAFCSTWDTTYGRKVFKYVYNAHTAALAAGYPVCRKNAGAAADTWSVIQPTTATIDRFAGVGIGAITTLYFGWIQVFGHTESLYVQKVTASLAAGMHLKIVDQTFYMCDDAAAGTRASYDFFADSEEAYTVTTASASKKAIIYAYAG